MSAPKPTAAQRRDAADLLAVQRVEGLMIQFVNAVIDARKRGLDVRVSCAAYSKEHYQMDARRYFKSDSRAILGVRVEVQKDAITDITRYSPATGVTHDKA